MCASSNAADVMWAKLNPYKSLIHHMLDSGACAEALMRTSFRSSAHQIAETLSVDEKCAVGIVAYIVGFTTSENRILRFSAKHITWMMRYMSAFTPYWHLMARMSRPVRHSVTSAILQT